MAPPHGLSRLFKRLKSTQPAAPDLPAVYSLLQKIDKRLEDLETKQATVAADVAALQPLLDINPRLNTINIRQKGLAADLASVIEDGYAAGLLKHDTVIRHRARKDALTIPAKERVFRVTEILESVLLELPMRELLLAQRVSTRFQQVIQDSGKIQQALFFHPAPVVQNGVPVRPVINPLLSLRSPPRSPDTALIVFARDGTPAIVRIGFVHEGGIERDRVGDEGAEDSSTEQDPYLAHGYIADIQSVNAVDTNTSILAYPRVTTTCHARGSWQRMLLTQPVCPVRCKKILDAKTVIHWDTVSGRMRDIWNEHAYVDEVPKTILEYRSIYGGELLERYGYSADERTPPDTKGLRF